MDPTTGELINFSGSATSTTSSWNNAGSVGQQLTCWAAGGSGYCGSLPRVSAWGANSNVINFSYGLTDLNQLVNVSNAIASANGSTTGINVTGFKFSFQAKNGNGWDNGQQDQLNAYVKFYDSTNTKVLENYNYDLNRKYNWTTFSYNETFGNPRAVNTLGNAQVGFVGRDTNNWVGPYGPEIINVSFALKYKVDPCALNPAYSSGCSGFNAVTTGSNIFNSSTWGNAVTQSVAINTALKNGGIGATVHGINYGFDYSVGQSWSGCTATNQDGSCSWYMTIPAQVNATARLTNSNNQSIFSKSYALNGDGTSGSLSGQYLLPTSLNQTGLGRVSLTGSTSGTGSSIGNFSASLIYTADPCVSNPLYNASCDGYAVAFAKNMLLGSTVASASGAIVSSGGTSMSANTGQVEQSQGNTQPEQTQQQSQQQQQQQSSPPQDSGQQTAVAPADPAQPAPAGSPGPAGATAQTQTSSSSTQQQSGGGGSAGPSKLAMSVVKSVQANDKATQNAAVQNASKTLENATQSSQASSNAAISMVQDMSASSATAAATFASQSTQTSIQASAQFNQQQTTQFNSPTQQTNRTTQQSQQQDLQTSLIQSTGTNSQVQQFIYTPPPQQQEDAQSAQVAVLKPTVPMVVEMQQQSSNGTGITVSRNLFAYNPLMSANTSNMSAPLPAAQPTYQPRLDSKQYEIETPQFQIASFSGAGRAGNPLSELVMQQRFELMQTSIAQPASSVNRNALPNELAGSIDIASIASVPAGFNAYSFVLRDAAFYEPKEVYKNQRTVDNERVLRGLTRGSDARHQEMINQQYKLGE